MNKSIEPAQDVTPSLEHEPVVYEAARHAHSLALAIRPEQSGDCEYWRIREIIQPVIKAILTDHATAIAQLEAERHINLKRAKITERRISWLEDESVKLKNDVDTFAAWREHWRQRAGQAEAALAERQREVERLNDDLTCRSEAVDALTREITAYQKREAGLREVLERIAGQPGPNESEGAHWRADDAISALDALNSEGA